MEIPIIGDKWWKVQFVCFHSHDLFFVNLFHCFDKAEEVVQNKSVSGACLNVYWECMTGLYIPAIQGVQKRSFSRNLFYVTFCNRCDMENPKSSVRVKIWNLHYFVCLLPGIFFRYIPDVTRLGFTLEIESGKNRCSIVVY